MAAGLDLNQFFAVFFEESQELLAEMESLLLSVDVSSPDREECNAIFRAAHSIKGGAATFGLADMVELAHVMESLLDNIRKGNVRLTEQHVRTFLRAKDVLKLQLTGHQKKSPVDAHASAAVLALLRDMSNPEANPIQEMDSFAIGESPVKSGHEMPIAEGAHCLHLELPAIAEDHLTALLGALRLKGNLVTDRLPDGRTVLRLETTEKADDVLGLCAFLLNPEDIQIAETPTQYPASGAIACAPLGKHDARPSASTATSPATQSPAEPSRLMPRVGESVVGDKDSSHIRVNLEKVDQLINLVGELVITQAMTDQHAMSLEFSEDEQLEQEQLFNNLDAMARNIRNLQESVMSIRMMPMDLVFLRFPRMVRELAEKLGKKVRLVKLGGATELDKGLIERIIDPLTHLVRNSIDHGIEPPSVRLAKNKSETGTITLSAFHEGGHIIVEAMDDGAGLDRGRIIQKARELGFTASEEMSDEEVWQILFLPGFTTSTSVSDVSGRGVGMDVVKRNIAAMGGSVDIRSYWGQGTTVTISLPLTLAIIDGMSIMSGEEVYILPLLSVLESLQPMPEQIHEIAGLGEVVRVRDEYIPLIPLYKLFDIEPKYANPTDGIIVVVEALGDKAALLVDSLVGQQQVVVKNLETNFRRIPGISGATILGDGNVSLILDVTSLLKISGQRH